MLKPYYEKDGILIYHGDCRDILPTLEPVDLVLTDPPYNVGKDYGEASSDSLTSTVYAEFMAFVVAEARRLAHKHAWVAPRYKMQLWWNLLPDAHEIIIPDRATNAIRGGWVSKYATVLAVGTPDPRSDDLWEGIRLKGTGYLFQEDTYGHPGYTPKPIMDKCSTLLSAPNATILDPFMGSGTTLRAAKDLGRQAIGIEIEERYCEIAANRLAQEVMAL